MTKHGIRSMKSLTLAVLCLLAIVAGTAAGTVLSSRPLLSRPPLTQMATLQCKYFNKKDFMNSVIAARQNQLAGGQDISIIVRSEADSRTVPLSDADSKTVPVPVTVPLSAGQNAVETADKSGCIAGGIVPHHLLAGKMIAEFFQALSQSSPETVAVIAPNHKRTGLNGLHTSTRNWGTAFGVLEADPVLTGKLINDLKASQNTSLMEEEHSISSLVPYIKYYLPKAKIVPVLLHGNYTPEASHELGKLLAEALSGNPSLTVIASVDFSHYLDADTADKMDEETLTAIKSNDIQSISMMGNDNLDSPPSIMTLLSTMEEIGAAAPEVIGHGNSSDITGSGADYTTGYYTMLFRR